MNRLFIATGSAGSYGARHMRSGVERITPPIFVLLLIASGALAQSQPAKKTDPLHDFSATMQGLSRRINPSVVQVFSSGYTLGEERDSRNTLTRQRASGSGVIVSADGYIVTNGHVVANAGKVRVRLPSVRPQGGSIIQPGGPIVEAKIVGVDQETDLAVLKVEAQDLPALAFGDSEALRQGEVVLAFGSPMGMANSMSMGVVSSNARQIKSDDPMIYIQTDASINPGNSGGPLIDANGNIVGINTFILTQSGGSEGLGFAIPSNIVKTVYAQLRNTGHVHRGDVGVFVQSITPALAKALRLPQDWGVLIADVTPDGPGAKAGFQINDIIVSLNGKRMENARQFDVNLYRHETGGQVALEVLHGTTKLSIRVAIEDRQNDSTRFTDMIDPAKSLVARLGILGIEIDKRIAEMVSDLRQQYGVLVAARARESSYEGDRLDIGDVIIAVNGLMITSVEALNQALDKLEDSDPLVLQIQRGTGLRYLTLENQ